MDTLHPCLRLYSFHISCCFLCFTEDPWELQGITHVWCQHNRGKGVSQMLNTNMEWRGGGGREVWGTWIRIKDISWLKEFWDELSLSQKVAKCYQVENSGLYNVLKITWFVKKGVAWLNGHILIVHLYCPSLIQSPQPWILNSPSSTLHSLISNLLYATLILSWDQTAIILIFRLFW